MAGFINQSSLQPIGGYGTSPFTGGSPNQQGFGRGMNLMGGTAPYNSAFQGGGYGGAFGGASGPINGLITAPALGKQWLLPGMMYGEQQIQNSMPQAGPFAQQSIDYANQANNASMANQAQNMATYLPQYAQASNAAWNSTLNTPQNQQMFNARNQLLAQQQKEASGSAPSYLQDYWREQAGGQLQNTMGAFGNSQLGAGSLANMMAANLYQYHTNAENALGNTINNWNTYTNPAYASTVSAFNPNTTQGWNSGYGYGQSAYQNATQPMQNVSKWFVS